MRLKSSVSRTLAQQQANTAKKASLSPKKGFSVHISKTVKYTSDDPHSACSLMRRIFQSHWCSK